MFQKITVFLLMMIVSIATGAETLAKEMYDVRAETGYTRAVKVGGVLYLSGVVGSGTMPEAIKSAYESIGKTLQVHGLDYSHIVKETIYTTKIDDLKESKEVRKKYYAGEYPAATWVQIDRLFKPEHIIEVDVIAYFPKSKD